VDQDPQQLLVVITITIQVPRRVAAVAHLDLQLIRIVVIRGLARQVATAVVVGEEAPHIVTGLDILLVLV
jgi:hypothetical protein